MLDGHWIDLGTCPSIPAMPLTKCTAPGPLTGMHIRAKIGRHLRCWSLLCDRALNLSALQVIEANVNTRLI